MREHTMTTNTHPYDPAIDLIHAAPLPKIEAILAPVNAAGVPWTYVGEMQHGAPYCEGAVCTKLSTTPPVASGFDRPYVPQSQDYSGFEGVYC